MSRSKGQRKKKASKANSRKTSDDTQGLSFTGTLKAMNKLLKAYHHEGYLSNLGPGQLPPAIEDFGSLLPLLLISKTKLRRLASNTWIL